MNVRTARREAWQWNQYVVTVAVFITFVGFSFVSPFLSLYIHRELGIEDMREVALWNGFLFGITPLLGAFSGPFWGSLADRFGYKAMVQRAMFSIIFVLTGMAFVQNVWHLLGLRVMLGLLGGINAMGMALITSITPRERTGQAVGMIQGARSFSQAVAPAFGGVMADTVGMRQSFIVSGALAVAAFLMMTFAYRETPETRQAARRGDGMSMMQLLRVPSFLAVFVALFLVQMVDQSFNPIMPLFVTMLEGNGDSAATYSGFIISAAALAITLSAALVGRFSSTFPPRRMMLVTLAAGMLVCIPIALARTTLEFGLWRIVLGLFAGGSVTLAFTLGGMYIPNEIRGSGFGLLTSATLIGNAVSPMLFGALAGINLRFVYGLDAVVYAIVLVWVIVVLGRVGRDVPVEAVPAQAGR